MEHELAAPHDGAHHPMRPTLARPPAAAVVVDPSLPLHQTHSHPHAQSHPHAHPHAHTHPHPHHHLQQQQQATHDHLSQFIHLTDPALLGPTPSATDFPIDPALHAVDPSLTAPVSFHHELVQAGYPVQHQHPHSHPHQPQQPQQQQPHQIPHQQQIQQLQQIQPQLLQQQQHQQHQQQQQQQQQVLPVDHGVDPSMAGEDSQPGPSSSPVVKRGSVFEDSDQELKRLAAENSAVPLKELATRVRDDENGPKAERARQILGMRWLLTSCERAADSSIAVPRNRVYARYVSMCANERIKPLNPASFGKLVRLMYPEIKTRRLGVRGHSKYHYCGIKLKGDPSSPVPKASQGSASGSEPPPQMAGEDHLAHNGSQPSSEFHIISLFPASNGHTSNTHTQRPYPDLSPIATFLQLDICFPSQEINDNALPSQRIELPEISPYAPPKHDHDTIASFSEIYRSHSTSLVECFRYMRLKQFFHLFATFLGTLTSPVHKLFAEPSIAEWIREADWTTYKYIIQLLSPLALQVLPPAVIAALKHFSANLTTHISTIFINEHTHTVEAKKEPAAIFSTLLNRLLRVNEAAHAAARILVHGPDRQIMREEWRQHVKCKSIVEREVPCRAAAVQRILEDEIMSLLQPQQEGSDPAPPSAGDDDDIDGMTTTESVLDRWTQFLAQLPHRFPEVPPRLFLLCVGAIATAALRDLTVAGSDSFGGWWIVRCWIDEWIGWMAERGGFLMHGVNDKPRMIVCQEKEEEDDDLDLAQDGCGNNSDSDLGLDDSGISMMRDDLLCINGELGRTGMVD